jgi:hypothetical protein
LSSDSNPFTYGKIPKRRKGWWKDFDRMKGLFCNAIKRPTNVKDDELLKMQQAL